ncbi:Mur ligase family protein [Salinibacterium soli]|uniref:MurT ligase domain-containing protein n=1 Tax=Antiquaquibacter soli TaxID=3064523 RepID=A0ABT9BM59_9MICO|nr:MurT ligase domain-containing protein [Protaetiibacter sp. WY-16]MDO7882090.1 MurT ligase domain-containing protein [Protaetiibacter sp. WY-16]
MPGRVLLALNPRFLSRAVERMPLGVVFVSGSNGKSTTTHMLVSILRAHGVSVFSNPTGANLPQGIASAMLASVPLDGRLREDVAVLEVDEAFGPRLAQQLAPHSVLLVNLQVDQLNRFYEPARVAGMLEQFARVATRHLVINGDDHNLVALAERIAGSGAERWEFAVDPALLDAGPAWLARGDNPALAEAGVRKDSAVTVESLEGRTAALSVGGARFPVSLPARGLHYAVDAAAATAMARALLGDRFDSEAVASGLAAMEPVYGRGEVLHVNGEDIELLTMKNPPSLQVNLDYLEPHPEQVFVAVDEGTPDPSWIYGSDLSRLDHVDVLTGTKAWQLATRFAYDEIPVHRVIPELAPALDAFLALPKPSRGVKTMIVNYEQMMLVRKQLGFLELEGRP